MPRTILHVDMDAFFVACEVRRDPTLAGKPVIVGGRPGGRGVVASCSYEARRQGVRSAMPSSQAVRLCPGAIFVRGHSRDYVETSRRLRALFLELTPLVEMASLDEAYLDLTGTEHRWATPADAALHLRERIRQTEGLPVSFGIAPTKNVAKIASDAGKPEGLVWVRPGEAAGFLAPRPIQHLRGVGPKTAERLQARGLRTIGDVAALGPERLRAMFGSHGEDLWLRATGQDAGEVTPDSERKSLGHETTFDHDLSDEDSLLATLSRLAEDVAAGLRARGLTAQRVTLKLRDSAFQTVTRAATLPTATSHDDPILEAARDLFLRQWRRGSRVRLLGVTASSLADDRQQLDLIDAPAGERMEALERAVDAIRAKHGQESIRRASSALRRDGESLPPWEAGGGALEE
ncbi:MAG: DNA polymerase IV [Candidatus Sumerlaeia bacterium]|nr:DNA polymerase IV [Candidatus Sumerlaeia bacterium]